jgi:hypothetical protein
MITDTVLSTQMDQDLFIEFKDETALIRYLLGNSAWNYLSTYQLTAFIIRGFRDPLTNTVEVLVRVTAPPQQLTWLRLNIDGHRAFD